MRIFLGVCIVFSSLLLSCTKAKVSDFNTTPDCTDTVSFAATIQPLIDNNCGSCHFSGNSTGYTLTNHTNISSSAAAVLNSMRGEAGFQQMPDGLPPISDSLIQLFDCWVSQGKLNN